MSTNLETRVEMLEKTLSMLVKSDRYAFRKFIELENGRNIQVGVSVGTKIATAGTQKLGFWGVAPVVQQNISAIAGGSSASDGTARTGVNSIITLLKAVGLSS